MKLAIIGSRDFSAFELLKSEVLKLKTPHLIISGGAKGADSLAERFAIEFKIPFKAFLPKFRTDPKIKYHPRYFHMRNREIVDACDFILAFKNKISKGTESTLKYATKINKPFKIILLD